MNEWARHGIFAGEAERAIGFFLTPTFSMFSFVAALEPLRVANRLAGRNLYQWRVFSADGLPVPSSSGIAQAADAAIREAARYPVMIVVGPFDPTAYDEPQVFAWLRRLARHGAELGGLCTGGHILARAGLLNGYRCTVHWENMTGFTHAFPEIELSDELYQIDRSRFTASGGTASLDVMLALIARDHGQALAAEVSESLLVERMRQPDEGQRMARQERLGASHPKLVHCIAEMEQNLERPWSPAQLAAAVGISQRQLERLFRRHLQTTPRQYYSALRLKAARRMLEQTAMPIAEIALACGFSSPAYFSLQYRIAHGVSPSEVRRQARQPRIVSSAL
ncbi:MAG: GlxA family transcriptional regulator [Alphaproteobacteria bacterium]|nr:GlxA family transcriptional regulator [Alphaproteobacteria bacterium]